MNEQEIRYYLQELATELDFQHIAGEMVIAGGAAMILTIGNRPSTKDIDAYFASGAPEIRQAVAIIARREHLPPDWLNDGVKGFFGTQPPLTLLMDVPGLRVYTVTPDYLLAMKVAAGRPADIPDIQALAAYLNITQASAILSIVSRYIVPSQQTPVMQYLIQTLFP